jgi:hypothetical protein
MLLSESYKKRLLELSGILPEYKNDKNIIRLINKHKEKFGDMFTFYSYYKKFKVSKKVDIVYIRFGEPRKDESGAIVASKRHVFGQEVENEPGVSVFEMFWDGEYIILPDQNSRINSSFDELMSQNRKIYLIVGKIDHMEEGADGEPVMIPSTVKVIAEIPKEMVFTEENYAAKKAKEEEERNTF